MMRNDRLTFEFETARDYKAVHGDVTALIACGLIERQTASRVAVLWHSVAAEFRLAACGVPVTLAAIGDESR